MSSIEVIEEKPLTLAEMREKLVEVQKRDKELNLRAKKTKEYLDHFAGLKLKKIEEIKKKLEGLKISRLKERHIVKLIDILPKDLGSLRLIFSGENVTLKQEDLTKILNILKDYK